MSEKKTNHSVSFEALSSLDAPVSFWKGIPFGLQHVMAMFVANLAPIFIVASAAKMTPAQSATIIQSGLLVAGLGTCLQLYGAWLIGSRLPMVTGISFTYVAAAVAICADKGYGAVVGAVMVGGLLELVLGLTAKYWRRFVPPIVSAIVVTSIGFSLLNVGATSFGGGSGASAKLEPVAFLVVWEGGVKLLPVAPPPATTADRVIEAVPEVVDKVTSFIKDQQDRKDKAADLAD